MDSLTKDPNLLDSPQDYIDPLVTEGGPYNSIRSKESEVHSPPVLTDWIEHLDPLSECFMGRPYWHYGVTIHASPPRRIIGCVIL